MTGRSRPARRGVAVAAAVAAFSVAACSSDEPPVRADTQDRQSGDPGPVPTVVGGVTLQDVDPATLLVGTELSFGTPLPSEQAAADAFTEQPEVSTATVRRVYDTPTGRRLGNELVLSLDGTELFDEAALSAFQDALVESLSGGRVQSLRLVGRRTLHATGELSNVVAFREGDTLVIASSPSDADGVAIVTRQLEAMARGEVGTGEARTPLVPTPPEAAFVPVPTIAFAPFSAPEDEEPPAPPALQGMAGVQGRYGVVAGERRTVVWSIAVDTGAHPTAEALQPAMSDLAASRADGVAAEAVELIDRVVLVSTNAVGEPSAHVFRHQGLVILVEGGDPAQLDAVTTAWIDALG